MKKLTFLLCCVVVCSFILFQNFYPQKPPIPIPSDAWQMPVDVVDSESRKDWLEFGWNTFIALNWPADNEWPKAGNGGRPLMSMNITDKEATKKHTVWQTYLEPGQLFLDGANDPGIWDNPTEEVRSVKKGDEILPIIGGFGEKGLYFLNQNPIVGLVLYDLAVTPNPVIDQSKNFVLLEVRLNQSEFEYFKEYGYYDACNQSAALQNNTFKYMPTIGDDSLPEWARQGAVEIKASWKILEDGVDIKERYFTTRGYYLTPDEKIDGPHTFGLTGLHILRNTNKSSDTWYWTTFEQVDNVKIYDKNLPNRPDGKGKIKPSFNPGPAGDEPEYTYGFDTEDRLNFRLLDSLKPPHFGNLVIEPPRLDSGDTLPDKEDRRVVNCSRVFDIQDDVQKLNKEFQERLKGTPWQYYEMIDAQYPDSLGFYQLRTPSGDQHDPRVYASTPALINTTMETYLTFKPSKWNIDNCLTCHFDAEPRSFRNQLGAKGATQVFSYLYRRALPKHPIIDTIILDRYLNDTLVYDTILPSKFDCKPIVYWMKNKAK